jgi:hypothetical protein
MSGKFIAVAVAIIGWLVASLVAFVIVALVGFFGIGLVGLVIVFVATQVELDSDGAVSGGINSDLLARQVEARRAMSPEQRAARRDEQSLLVQSVNFFKYFGIGLVLIGFGGFAYYQL